jgi:cation transport ATPase
MSDGMRREELVVKEAQRAHDRIGELEDQLNDGALKTADLGLRTLIAINGAAFVSLLAFVGAALKEIPYGDKAQPIVESFWWFAVGVGVATLAILLIILSFFLGALKHHFTKRQFAYPYLVSTKTSTSLLWIAYFLLFMAVVCGVGSLGVFIRGCLVVWSSLDGLMVHP